MREVTEPKDTVTLNSCVASTMIWGVEYEGTEGCEGVEYKGAEGCEGVGYGNMKGQRDAKGWDWHGTGHDPLC